MFEAGLDRKVFCYDLPPLRVSLRFRLPIRRLIFGFMSEGFGHVFLCRCIWMFGFNFDFFGEIGWGLVLYRNHCHFFFRRCGQIFGLTSIIFSISLFSRRMTFGFALEVFGLFSSAVAALKRF